MRRRFLKTEENWQLGYPNEVVVLVVKSLSL